MRRLLYILLCILACAHADGQSVSGQATISEQSVDKQSAVEQAAMRATNDIQDSINKIDIEHYNSRYDILTLSYGGHWLQDSYLSPLVYDGWQIGAKNEWWTPFSCRQSANHTSHGGKQNWQHTGTIEVFGGKTIQSHKHNSVSMIDLQGGWGASSLFQYNTGLSKGIHGSCVQWYIGPYINLDLMIKEQASEVNKPYSFDMGVDLCLMAGANYAFIYKKSAYRLSYDVRINLLGGMWLPDYWQSYYEVTEKVNIGGNISVSYPGNRQHLQQQLTMDFQFKKSTWRLGCRHEYLHYGDANRHFARQSVSIVVGTIFNYYLSRKEIGKID